MIKAVGRKSCLRVGRIESYPKVRGPAQGSEVRVWRSGVLREGTESGVVRVPNPMVRGSAGHIDPGTQNPA